MPYINQAALKILGYIVEIPRKLQHRGVQFTGALAGQPPRAGRLFAVVGCGLHARLTRAGVISSLLCPKCCGAGRMRAASPIPICVAEARGQ
jgi:hypothetical protein